MSKLSIYIDEAGDPGVRDGLKYIGDRHEWLCVSAIAVRTSRRNDVVDWVKELRSFAGSTQSGALHYNRINLARRESVCAALARRPCRAFVLASHKSNLREYVNPRIGAMIAGGTFYNWCLRLLLERVTKWAEDWHAQEGVSLEPIELTFASRGHDWDHFFKYVELLRFQKEAGQLFLKGPGLAPTLLDQGRWTVERAADVAGLQLADTVASAFYQASNTVSPAYDVKPAMALSPVITNSGGSAANVGVTVFPLPNQAPIPDEARPIFRHFGYSF